MDSDGDNKKPGGARLFVGGLAWQTDEEGLKKAFSEFGDLEECRIITDRNTGRSKGFGFVTFKDKAAGDEAIAKLNGAELDGRTIKCDYANEGERSSERRGPYDRDRRGGGGGGFRGGGRGGGFRGGSRDGGNFRGGRGGGGGGDYGRSYRRDRDDRGDRGDRDRDRRD